MSPDNRQIFSGGQAYAQLRTTVLDIAQNVSPNLHVVL